MLTKVSKRGHDMPYAHVKVSPKETIYIYIYNNNNKSVIPRHWEKLNGSFTSILLG